MKLKIITCPHLTDWTRFIHLLHPFLDYDMKYWRRACSAARIESPVVLQVEGKIVNSLTGRTGSNIIELNLRIIELDKRVINQLRTLTDRLMDTAILVDTFILPRSHWHCSRITPWRCNRNTSNPSIPCNNEVRANGTRNHCYTLYLWSNNDARSAKQNWIGHTSCTWPFLINMPFDLNQDVGQQNDGVQHVYVTWKPVTQVNIKPI